MKSMRIASITATITDEWSVLRTVLSASYCALIVLSISVAVSNRDNTSGGVYCTHPWTVTKCPAETLPPDNPGPTVCNTHNRYSVLGGGQKVVVNPQINLLNCNSNSWGTPPQACPDALHDSASGGCFIPWW